MEFLGVIIFFVIAAAISAAMKAAGNQQRPQQPRWPGPVAGPRMPGYPQFPQRPTAPAPARPPVVSRPQDDDDDEGVTMMGNDLGPSVEEEVAQFDASAGRFVAQPVVRGDLKETTEPYNLEGEGAKGAQLAALNRSGLAQAVVMAEVLGKPKALRNRER